MTQANQLKNSFNEKLQDICEELKSIPNIGLNYMEYLSALIYVIYENREILKKKLEIEEIKYIVQDIDNKLYIIRQKEKSYKLFSNIKFTEIINREDYVSFKEVLIKLDKIIMSIEKEGKQKLAEAFEHTIMKAAQNNEISLKNRAFYTPKGVVKTMVKLLDIKNSMAIYNPVCGTGNFITESAKSADIYAFGEETDISNYNICITNLWLHDIYNKRIKENREEKFQLADIAIANPPFVNNNENMQKKEEIYYQYGIQTTISSYIDYLVMMLQSIHDKGKMAIILPQGFLFKRTIIEQKLRRELIERNYIEAIIGLPEKLFYNTKIPVIILIMNKAKKTEGILFIDASREYTHKRKTNILTIENQDKIVNVYKKYKNVENYSYIANLEEIRHNDYDLNIKKYVKIKEEIQDINQLELEKNINKLEDERYEIQREMKKLLKNINLKR